jgi:hypothetical protein
MEIAGFLQHLITMLQADPAVYVLPPCPESPVDPYAFEWHSVQNPVRAG